MMARKQRPQGGYRSPGTQVKNRPATDKRAALWLAMRVLRRFDVGQLMTTTEATRSNAQTFVTYLWQAGILRCVVKGAASRKQMAVYQLVIDNGPKAPITRRSGDVYDPNVDRIYAPGGAIKGEGHGQASP